MCIRDSIQIWEAGTQMAPRRRGVKLLAKLTGDAADKMVSVDPDDLLHEDGVDDFKTLIKLRYEPIENHNIGRVMDNFFDVFHRSGSEQIMDYSIRFEQEVKLAEQIAGELTPK